MYMTETSLQFTPSFLNLNIVQKQHGHKAQALKNDKVMSNPANAHQLKVLLTK